MQARADRAQQLRFADGDLVVVADRRDEALCPADFMAGKILSVLGIPHALYPAWTGEVPAAQPAAGR